MKTCIGISSSADWTYIIAHPIGSINYIHACLDCGGIYLPEQYRNVIRAKAKLN